jgi:hypothetical protein
MSPFEKWCLQHPFYTAVIAWFLMAAIGTLFY